MFYDQNQILNILNCSKCLKEFDEPRLLPCGNTVCNNCITILTRSRNPMAKYFECAMCLDEHVMPIKGFPINKSLLKLLEQKPKQVYRGKLVEEFEANLESIRAKNQQLEFDLNNADDKIKEHCMNLRCQVHAAADIAILKINELSDSMFAEINEYERECIRSFQLHQVKEFNALKIERFKQRIVKVDTFYKKWSAYLKNVQLDEEAVTEANKLALKFDKKANEDNHQMKKFIYGNKVIEFEKSTKVIETNLIGAIKFTQLPIHFSETINIKNVLLTNALPDSIVVDADTAEDGDIFILYLGKNSIFDQFQLYFLKYSNSDLHKLPPLHFPLKNALKNFKKYKEFIYFLDPDGLFHIYKLSDKNIEAVYRGNVKLEGASLICMNDKHIFCLSTDQHNLVFQKPNNKDLMRRIKYQSTDAEKPFYFASDVKQLECAGGKYIWLNETRLQILDEITGEGEFAIEIVADKFVMNSKNQICLFDKNFERLDIFHINGTLLAVHEVEEHLYNQPFFLNKQDKFIFFNKNNFDLYLP